MYRSNLNTTDKGGAIAAVVAIHGALLFALLNLSGQIELVDPQSVLDVFDVTQVEPQPERPVVREEREQPAEPEEGEASPENIRSEATEIVDPRPEISLPIPVPMETTETPGEGVDATQGAAEVPGPGTGAGGVGTGTGAGGSGSGTGGGGGGVVTPPQLLTPPLTGRDFPRQLLRSWPGRAQVFTRIRVSATGGVADCIVDRGTGIPQIDRTVCNLVRQRFRYRPALDERGQPIAGWHGYRQVAPR